MTLFDGCNLVIGFRILESSTLYLVGKRFNGRKATVLLDNRLLLSHIVVYYAHYVEKAISTNES